MTRALSEGIVDAHVHIWPDPRPARPYSWTPDPHPVEELLPVLDASGVRLAIQVTPTIMAFDNDYGLEAAERHPGRLGVFGRFDPHPPALEARLEAWMAHPAAAGIRLTFFGASAAFPEKLHALAPLWEACADRSVPVAVLAPDALGALAEVADRHRGLRLIVDHLGLGVYPGSVDPFAGWPRLADLAAVPDLMVKISTLVETSVEPHPFPDVHDRLAEAVEVFGAERLVWASNYPVVLSHCSYEESLTFLGACSFLNDEQLAWLTHRSFEAFLGQSADTTP